MSVFEFKDYRDFLKSWISEQPKRGRGLQAKMAEAASVQATFMSQVLNKKTHPSSEQAFALAQFMRLGDKESDFFQIQVQLERAGSLQFKNYLEGKKKTLILESRKISSHLQAELAPSELDQQRYFSSWIYPAIHLLILIPQFSNSKAIGQRLSLSLEKVEEAILFLLDSGILEKNGDQYKTSKLRLHAEKGSPQLMGYQLTTRARAAQKISEISQDVHFTSIHSASREDFEKLKTDVLTLIRKSDRRITQSKEEDIFGFTIDLFQF